MRQKLKHILLCKLQTLSTMTDDCNCTSKNPVSALCHDCLYFQEKMSDIAPAAGWTLVDADGIKTTLPPMTLTVGGTLDSDVTIEVSQLIENAQAERTLTLTIQVEGG